MYYYKLQIPPLISFQDGKIGVNFLGFHAAAGLGGLLNGGGLHAEAGTPFGQKAAAGLGGAIGQDGSAAGNIKEGSNGMGHAVVVTKWDSYQPKSSLNVKGFLMESLVF